MGPLRFRAAYNAELWVLLPFEPFVDDRRIGWQRNAVQINDLSIDNQIDVVYLEPEHSRVLYARDRAFRRGRVIRLTAGWTMDDDTRFAAIAEKEVRAAQQEDRSPLAFHFQNVRPGGLELLPFGEADGVVQVGRANGPSKVRDCFRSGSRAAGQLFGHSPVSATE